MTSSTKCGRIPLNSCRHSYTNYLIETPQKPYRNPNIILIETPIESLQKSPRFPLVPLRFHIEIHIEIVQNPFESLWNDCRDPCRIIIASPVLQKSSRILTETPTKSSRKFYRILYINPFQNPFRNPSRNLADTLQHPIEILQNSDEIPIEFLQNTIEPLQRHSYRNYLIGTPQSLCRNPHNVLIKNSYRLPLDILQIPIGSLEIPHRNPCRIHIEILQNPFESLRNPRKILIESHVLQKSSRILTETPTKSSQKLYRILYGNPFRIP